MHFTDKEWEDFGKNDPYYGVLTDEKFKTKNLNETIKEEFFATGESYAKHIFSIIDSETQEVYFSRNY